MLSTYKLRSEKLIEEEGGAREIITGTSTCISSGSLYRTIANNADINTNIEFVNDNGSVTDRTNGLFRLQSTASEACPVYYYRGIVDNNYVSFANKCWKIVRTTSTGGVKIIYYGDLGTGGKCKSNSTGSIQEAPFNTQTSSNHSGAEAGYMYGKWYATQMLPDKNGKLVKQEVVKDEDIITSIDE